MTASDQTRPTDDQSGSRAPARARETTADIDVDVIEARVVAAGDAWRAEAPASVAALIYDAGALLAEVRRLLAALAEAEAALRAAEQVFRGVEALPSTYTRAPGLNGDRVADLLSADCYRLGAEGRAILSAALDRAGAGRASAPALAVTAATSGDGSAPELLEAPLEVGPDAEGGERGEKVGGDGQDGEQDLDHGELLSGGRSSSGGHA